MASDTGRRGAAKTYPATRLLLSVSLTMTRVVRWSFYFFLLFLGTVAIGLAAASYWLVPSDERTGRAHHRGG